MDSLESIILVLVSLCILILFKKKSNRNIEGFGLFGSIWRGIKKAAKAIAAKAKAAYEAIKMAAELSLLTVQLPWLIPSFFKRGGKSAQDALKYFHRTISVYISKLRKFGFDTYNRTKNTIDKKFNLAINTINHTAMVSIEQLLKIFSNIIKKITDLLHTELISNIYKGFNESLLQVKNIMTYTTKTIKNTLINVKKKVIILYYCIVLILARILSFYSRREHLFLQNIILRFP